MFKIKVGLKSFQTHSMQRCKHQIERIVSYLKQSQTSFSTNWKKTGDNSMCSLVEKRATALKKKPFGFVFLNKKTHKSLPYTPTVREQVSMRDLEQLQLSIKRIGPTSTHTFAKQMHHIEPPSVFYKVKDVQKCIFATKRQENLDVCKDAVFGVFSLEKTKKQKTPHFCTAKQKGGERQSQGLKRRGDPSTRVESPSNQKNQKIESFLGVTPLPTLMKKMTTLRSPHIDKKSREQFGWKREKAQIYFDLNSVPQISFVLFILTHSRFPGVEIEIGVESKTYFA